MSFILDAVKKSEQERRYTQMDSVQSWHYQPYRLKPKKHYWIGVMVLINTLVLATLVIWLVKPKWFPISITFNAVQEEATISEVIPEIPEVKVDEVQPVMVENIQVKAAENILEPSAQVQAPVEEPLVNEVITPSVSLSAISAQEVALDIASIPDLEALPESIMIHIPAIAFSSHLYSSEPTARQVVVNGQKLRQGDYLNRDLQLLEIQEKSVIFQQFQYPFKVLLSRYWVRSE